MRRSGIEEDPGSESEWVLESLVGFLKGPLWNQPLFSFLDHKSVGEFDYRILRIVLTTRHAVFDPEDDGSNDKEYEIIFKEYKECVSSLLDSHMEELGITTTQFETACEEAGGVLSRKFHHSLFEQIWAANDFPAFKRMMIQVNIDLQLWALELLAAKFGRVPNLFLPQDADAEEFLSGDDFFLREAKRRSMIESEIEPVTRQMVKVQMERRPTGVEDDDEVAAQSNLDEQEPRTESSPSNKSDELQRQEQTLNPLIADFASDSPVVHVSELEISTRKPRQTNQTIPKSRPQPASLRQLDGEKMDEEEIKHRQEYLRRQRDKLLGLKREEREKQAARLDRLEQSGRRPQTAKFMAMEKGSENPDEQKDRTRAYMRSLAARIKAEVLDTEADEEKK